VCDLETSRMGAPYIYDISRLRVKDLHSATYIYVVRRLRVKVNINDDGGGGGNGEDVADDNDAEEKGC